MEQRLLDALNNLSFALEEISDALKDKKGSKSDTTTALQSGNFSKTINEINVGIKSIKKDTEKILKQQKTILELSKKKQVDKKMDAFDGDDDKKQGSIKKGVTSILLIAVGVLAIGLAFKLVGKFDFFSVIALGIGIYAVSVAFDKIGRLKDLSYRKVFMISSVMPLMGMGIWLASKFLARVSPMSIGQIVTSIGVATAFYFIAPVITSMMDAMMNTKEVTLPGGKKIKTSKFDFGRLKATIVALPILMVAMALGITASSWVLSKVKPMGLGQIITAIAISGMFAIAAMGIKGLIQALTEENEVKGKNGFKTKSMDMSKLSKIAVFLPIVMLAIAVGITLSSYVLQLIKPITLGKAITAILIAGMFAVVSWGIGTMLTALSKIKGADIAKSAMLLPLLLPAMALAIAASSWVLALVNPISLAQFLTSLAISILFIAFSVTLLVLAKANVFGKIGLKDIVKIPAMFVALSLAIMLSSWILSASAEITFGRSLEILAFSVVLCIAVIVVALTALLVTKIGDVKMYAKAGISIVILAASIMMASLLIDKGEYNKYPGWKWSLSVGLSLVIFGGISWALMKIGSVTTYIKGAVAILVVAATIMATSHVINLGKYTKYPSIKWSLGVGLALALFGVGAVLLGTQALNPFFYAGLGVMVLVAGVVVAASHLLALGNYKKYPTVSWGMGVGLALGQFAVGAVLLGTQVLNPFFYAGLGEILLVSGTVVAASHILNKGNYKKYPTVSWSGGVGLALAGFGLGAVLLGFNVLNPFFGSGLKMIKKVAQTIVDVSHILTKGAWNKYPDIKWAMGISNLFKHMDPTFDIISKYDGFMSSFDDVINNMMKIGKGMVKLAKLFANSATWKYPPLSWGEGVAKNVIDYVDVSNYVSNRLDFFAGDSIRGLVTEMALTARIIKANRTSFLSNIPATFMKNLSSNILAYALLTRQLDKIMTVEEKKSISFGIFGSFEYTNKRSLDLSNVNRVAYQMGITARIMSSASKYMKDTINPNYMKNLSSNILYYASLSRMLRKEQTIGNFARNLAFGDPISNVADGMVKLAKAYDRLSVSLKRLGGAMKTIDAGKLKQFNNLTANVAVLSALNSSMFDNMLQVLESRSSVFAKILKEQSGTKGVESSKRPQVGAGKTGEKSKEKKGKHGDLNRQMDILIELMAGLIKTVGEGSTLDSVLQKALLSKKAGK